jgi:ribosomal protein S18 acetylase RimI-like enzyme
MAETEPTPTKVTIRAALPPDAADIARVHVEAWRAAYVGIVPQAVLDRLSIDRRTQFWARRLADPGESRTFVAVRDGRIVGFASTGRPADPEHPQGTAELETIYLLPKVWRVGVGRLLMRHSMDDLVERGFSSAILWVLTENERGRRFYKAVGWQSDGRVQKLAFDGTAVEEMRYRFDLRGGSTEHG